MKKNKLKVLRNVVSKKTTPEKAYDQLYRAEKKKLARFIKLRIKIPEHQHVTNLLRLLFIFPVSVKFLKFVFQKSDRMISHDVPIKFSDLFAAGIYKGSEIAVKTEDNIKIFIKAI